MGTRGDDASGRRGSPALTEFMAFQNGSEDGTASGAGHATRDGCRVGG